MARERPDLEALNAWFRRRQRDWWRRNWPLVAASLALMLGAIGSHLAYSLIPFYNQYVVIYILGYLVVVSPLLALTAFTLVLIHALPPQDMALAFDRSFMYRTALKHASGIALTALALLWLLPWVVTMVVEYVAEHTVYSFILRLFRQGCALSLAVLQLQACIVIYFSLASLRRIHIYLAPLLLVVVGLPTLLLELELIADASGGLLALWLSVSETGCAMLFVALLVRTLIMPRDFRGYWQQG